MTGNPHASWAEIYDTAYQRSFGASYDYLTDITVKFIAERLPLPASIVDFGAGTGRLSISLSQMEYAVTAVEPCQEMLTQLRSKDPHNSINPVCSKMEDFRGDGKFDLALCVFTVILYLLDENSLKKSLTAAYDALRPNGLLILDIPSEAIFTGYSIKDPGFERIVSITRTNDSVYDYKETLAVTSSHGSTARYEDAFQIRHWDKQKVMEILQEIGFVDCEDLTVRFSGSGSSYYRLKKPNKDAG